MKKREGERERRR